jgi:hypothetical protein
MSERLIFVGGMKVEEGEGKAGEVLELIQGSAIESGLAKCTDPTGHVMRLTLLHAATGSQLFLPSFQRINRWLVPEFRRTYSFLQGRWQK